MEINVDDTLARLGANKDKHTTERGELLRYFEKISGWPIKRVAGRVSKVSIPDLYYLKSKCEVARNPGAWFNWATNPKTVDKGVARNTDGV